MRPARRPPVARAVAAVAGGRLQDTFARQILLVLRRHATETDSDVIEIADPHLSHAVRLAAADDGFRDTGSILVGYVLNVCGPADEVGQASIAAARRARLIEPPLLRSGMPAVAVAEVERAWWPAKVTDSDLPTYVVPIQQAFSSDLLGMPATMLPRQDFLGLSREHVYYRGAGGVTPKAPARVLWYMSSTSASARPLPYPSAIVACSSLDAVAVGAPAGLHSRFRHLGVWRLDQVTRAARGRQAQALVFGNTEVFPRPVSVKRLRELGDTFGGFPIPRQPVAVPSQLFAEIYREGWNRG